VARRGIGIRLWVKMEKVKKLFTIYELILYNYHESHTNYFCALYILEGTEGGLYG